MERLEKPEAKGILAFLSSTPPKSAENAEKEREEREKASAEKFFRVAGTCPGCLLGRPEEAQKTIFFDEAPPVIN